MTSPFPLALASASVVMLTACGAPAPVDPAANQVESLPANVVVDADQPAPPQPEPRRQRSRIRPTRSRACRPDRKTTSPPPPTAPAPPPRRDIQPSPIQPPAEVDPVLPDPGPEVPR